MQTNLAGALSGVQRPLVIGDPALPEERRTLGRWFNTGAFISPGEFKFGNAPRFWSQLRGPGISDFTCGLLKDIHLTEDLRVQFRSEFINAFNIPKFAEPNQSAGSPAFGTITSTGAPNREIRFALRIVF
ncbi:MAG: hypothetical protein ACREEM_26035 [Blastocatellia bacterium]